MRFMSMWSIIITSVIIRARAMSCSFHYLAQQAWMTAPAGVDDGPMQCRERLGGLLKYYERKTA